MGARASVAVLSGAGMSTAAGIPDFRGPHGVWTLHPEQASVYDLDLFLSDRRAREYSWRWQKESPVWTAQPGAAHRALVRLEEAGALSAVATQNFDGLHTRAGNSAEKVIELHGSIATSSCLRCGTVVDTAGVMARLDEEPDPRCRALVGGRVCAGLLKTDVVYFGQALPEGAFERAQEAVARAEELWVIGSTLEVWPVAGLVPFALGRGKPVTIVNRGRTPFDDEARVIRDDIETVVPELVEQWLATTG